jgi:hypothetical protein
MKHAISAFAALSSLVCLAVAPAAQSRTIRQDVPCPFGGAGPPNASAWSPSTTVTTSPFNPGGAATNLNVLVAGSSITSDDINNLAISGATMYAYYAVAPDASSCAGNPFGAPGPNEQVVDYSLTGGQSIGAVALPTGAYEVDFNYAPGFTGSGASFTLDGVTYTSATLSLISGNANDFIFNANGSLFGSVSNDGTSIAVGALPTNWKSSSGTVSAPEIDASSAVTALTLLLGGLAVLRGGRRALIPVR